jgi:regulator of replication initiation timing
MTKVQQIEQQIRELSATEISELREWLEQLDADNWDRQIEADVNAGKLDALADRALRAKAAGKTTEL